MNIDLYGKDIRSPVGSKPISAPVDASKTNKKQHGLNLLLHNRRFRRNFNSIEPEIKHNVFQKFMLQLLNFILIIKNHHSANNN